MKFKSERAAKMAYTKAEKAMEAAMTAEARRYEVVTYNGRRFDLPVLEHEFARAGMPLGLDPARTVDVADLTRRRYRGERERPLSRKLGDQCAFFRVPLSKAHRAADDAAATGLLLLELVRRGHASDRLSALRAGR